ncbi:MAG: AAA family ATPase [Verrucomicrobiales bacterium]|nr:AAA family ATPase [Verrucomicrobiales bacterium]
MTAIKWLQEHRRLDGALLSHMGVKVTQHPDLGEVLAFPYRRNGEAYAAKFRTVEKQWRSSKGITRGLYNADALTKDKGLPIVITEGEIDCLTVMQSGFIRAVSLPDGWTEKGNKTDALIEALDGLLDAPFVIVAGDNDASGESLPRTVANLLSGQDVRYVEWPNGCKDANDVLMAFGEGEVAACLNAAKRIDPPGGFITALSDLPPLSDRRVLRGGHELIDERLAFELGAMSVGTGTPGAGKSTFTTWVAHHIAAHESIRVGMMSFETHPYRTRDHLCRLITGRPFDALASHEQVRALEVLDERFRIVHRTYDDDTSHALGWLKSMVHTLAMRDQCKMIIIDPWNELEHLPEPGESLTNYINFALQQIRQWAEKLETHICVIAHPKKMDLGREPRPPMGYDVADSAAFANKPALGFTVHENKTETGGRYTQIYTWKVRDTQLYQIEKGKSDAAFDIDRMDYTKITMEQDDA